MPKQVDHEVRRQEIAQAMWRLIAREGTGAASVRNIAAEGGWSLGAVRHYASSQDELLRFAAEMMYRNSTARVRAVIAENQGVERWQAAIEELMPLDEERVGEVRAWLAVLMNTHNDPLLAPIRQEGWEGLRLFARSIVAGLADTADVAGVELSQFQAPLAEPLEELAHELHIWLDGLTLHAAAFTDFIDADYLRNEVTRQLQRLQADLARLV